MAETLPRHYIFGIILMSMMVLGGVALMTGLETDGSFTGNSNFQTLNETFDGFNSEVLDLSSELNNSIQSDDQEGILGSFGKLNDLINLGWNTLTALPKSLLFMSKIFMDIPNILPWVPSWLPPLILALIITLLVFAVLSAIFQRDV